MGIAKENLFFKPSLRVINDEQIDQIQGMAIVGEEMDNLLRTAVSVKMILKKEAPF